jgi:hypothetical protein
MTRTAPLRTLLRTVRAAHRRSSDRWIRHMESH